MIIVKNILKIILRPIFFRVHTRKRGKLLELKFWEKLASGRSGKWNKEYTRRLDPDSEVSGHHRQILDHHYSSGMKILDVGSGPLSGIGHCYNGNRLSIYACDPNAEEYNLQLDKHGITPPVQTMYARGENLSGDIKGKYDWINCDNALDHTSNPNKVITEMQKVLRPGGIISLLHVIDEGLKEGYRGYHKWNIRPDGTNAFVIWNPKKSYKYVQEHLGLQTAVETTGKHVLIIMKDVKGHHDSLN
ncbi:MAG: methyltransferase domain-containing protein [Pseudomonadota bacterium]|nr:methyltransferase domain-containing protein [Pseudomonadota bacterium]